MPSAQARTRSQYSGQSVRSNAQNSGSNSNFNAPVTLEESIEPFNGTKDYPVKKWIIDFENIITLLGWSDLHAFIFAKKIINRVS